MNQTERMEAENEENAEKKLNRTGLVIFLSIITLALTVAVISLVRENRNEKSGTGGANYVAVLRVSGVIQDENKNYNQEWLLDTIKRLKSDRKNVAALLVIDSPGGTVYEADEVYLALKEYAAEKTLWAYLGAIAASGGYYIACSADHIAANRNTLTGSIGVISGQAVDLSGLMEKYGVKVTTITAGRNKNMLNFNEPFSPEQQAIMQSIADECYEQFTGIVSDERGIPLETVREIADGRVYTAKQAPQLELIDEVAFFDDTLESLRSSFSPPPRSREFAYMPKKTFADLLFASVPLRSPLLEPALPAAVFETVAFPAYYQQF